MTNSASFDPAVNYGVGSTPTYVVIQDLNGDGKADLVTANYNSSNISVLLGNGDGTFGSATNFAVGNFPNSIVIRDFNADGKADVVTANSGSNNISVLLGNGDGTFGSATNFAAGSRTNSVATADFNADGKADVVTANLSSNNISVLLGNGDGTFGSATNFAAGSGTISVATADFNADGKADVVTANSNSNNISVLLGNGDGTFGSATNLAVGNFPYSVSIGDLNGDGKADLVTSNLTANTVSVLLGNGDGTFGTATSFAAGNSPFSVSIGDVNGDAKADLVIANFNTYNISVLLGNGDGTFEAATTLGVDRGPTHVAIGDLNNDGKADLVSSNFYPSNISVLLNTTPSNVSIIAQTATANEGGSNGVYRISRNDTGGALTINLTIDGSSTAASGDYTLSGGSVTVSGNTLSVTLANGQSFVDLNLAAIEDIQAEAGETLTLNLDTGTGYTVDSTNNTATVTIAANDTVVTNTNDSGEGSLRQAILNANANPGADTITFAGSVFTDATPDTITLTSGVLTITDDVTIEGTGANQLIVSGNNASRVFNISNSGTDATIDALTIADGNSADGGGIRINSGASLVLTNSTISNNNSGGGFGGAGIGNAGGTVNVINSTISGNTSSSFGGGIASQGTLTVTNSTISGNTASRDGGGLIVGGVVTFTSSTITNNTADSDNNGSGNGGGLAVFFGTTTAQNTIIAGNFDTGNQTPDIAGNITGNANNLIGSLSGASGTIGTGSDITFASAGITNINQVLAALANNGGATQTHALVAGSAAINAGNNALVPGGVTTDQRGTGFNRISRNTVDIGAYEVQNNNPIATDDIATTDEDTVLTGNLLTNDTDADGDTLTVSAVNGVSAPYFSYPTLLPSGALLTVYSDGNYEYDPNIIPGNQFQSLAAGQTTTDSFTYTVSDGQGGTSDATVTITITGVNDAPTGSPTATLSNTPEDTAIIITAANLLTGFTDVDASDTLSVANLTATNGALVNNNNGTYTFTPNANFNGTVNLTYDVTDGVATLTGQTQTFSVTAVNDAPVAGDDSASTFFGTTVNIAVSTLLANDTDVDSTGLSITGVSGATYGTAVLNNNGTANNTADDFVSFTPNLLFVGNASFNYTLSDGSLTDTATVTVAVGGNILGTVFSDSLIGTIGNDIINGGNGNDTIYGGAGNDSLDGGNGNDVLYGDGLMDGGAGNDTLNGGNGDDTLYGGGGSDRLTGGNGNDIIFGGLSSDILTGNNGNDIFAFAAGEGTDTITDFSDGNDLIGLYGGLSFGQLSFSASNIKVTSTNEILATLTGINTTTLTAADFVTV